MGVTPEQFYDDRHVAFLPMGFCFPGLDSKGGDLPPRRECAPLWRRKLLDHLPDLQLTLLVGQYAQRWHLTEHRRAPWRASLSDTVRQWRTLIDDAQPPVVIPLPHPSWRNNTWLKANAWFEAELVPDLRARINVALKSARA